MRKAFIESSIWDTMLDHELNALQQLLYLRLRTLPIVEQHGLYECGRGFLARMSGMEITALLEHLSILQVKGLIVFDNGMMFVPAVADQQSFAKWNQRLTVFRASIRRWRDTRSETGGLNASFAAWLRHHEELFGELTAEELQDLITPEISEALGWGVRDVTSNTDQIDDSSTVGPEPDPNRTRTEPEPDPNRTRTEPPTKTTTARTDPDPSPNRTRTEREATPNRALEEEEEGEVFPLTSELQRGVRGENGQHTHRQLERDGGRILDKNGRWRDATPAELAEQFLIRTANGQIRPMTDDEAADAVLGDLPVEGATFNDDDPYEPTEGPETAVAAFADGEPAVATISNGNGNGRAVANPRERSS